jgi:hypothetical protein
MQSMHTSLQQRKGKIVSLFSSFIPERHGEFYLSTSPHTEANVAAELNNIVFIKINFRCMRLQFIPIKAKILVGWLKLLLPIRKVLGKNFCPCTRCPLCRGFL